MGREKQKGVTAQEAEVLRRMRRQLGIVRKARMRCNQVVATHAQVKSPKFDGMPRSKSLPCGLDGSTKQAEALLDVLEREERKLRSLRKSAQRIVSKLTPELYEFCLYYYMEGLGVKATADAMLRCERSCWRYKAIIEQEAEER